MAAPEPTPRTGPRSVLDLLGDLITDLTGIVTSEGRLLRAELTQAGTTIAKGAEMMAAGAIFLLLAAFVLIQALVIALAAWLGAQWASLAVGVVLLIIGAVLIARARRHLSTATLTPNRTLAQTSRDARLAKDLL